MLPQELIDTVSILRTLCDNGKRAYNNFSDLILRVETIIDRSDPLSLPLTQMETDHIVAVYTPEYLNSLILIENAGDSLGTDAFG